MLNKTIIKHYLLHLLIFLSVINLVLSFSTYQYLHHVSNCSQKVGEYFKDPNKISKIIKFNKFYDHSTNSYYTTSESNNNIYPSTKINTQYKLYFNFHFDENLNLIIYLKNKDILVLNNRQAIINILKFYLYINFTFILFFTYLYFRNTFIEKRNTIFSIITKEGNIQEKYINLLNENINHELNTPLAILSSKLKKLENEVKEARTRFEDNNSNKTCEIIDMSTFKMMGDAIDMITNIAEKTGEWKQIKYSNGNKSIHDIITSVIKMMILFTKSNVRFDVDPILLNYSLDGTYKNSDLQLCIMNHIKNSIEAKANIINFEGKIINNYLHLFIGDNGIGIKDKNGKIIQESKWDKIFNPYYSTKDGDDCDRSTPIRNYWCNLKEFFKFNIKIQEDEKQIRGIGTYINRETLRKNGGNLEIRETSNDGTVFQATMKVKIKG